MMCLCHSPAVGVIFHTLMARYSITVLKVQLSTNKPSQTCHPATCRALRCSLEVGENVGEVTVLDCRL